MDLEHRELVHILRRWHSMATKLPTKGEPQLADASPKEKANAVHDASQSVTCIGKTLSISVLAGYQESRVLVVSQATQTHLEDGTTYRPLRPHQSC